MADVESLELQITGDATSATKSLDALIKTLDRLKKATSGGCGLSSVAVGLKMVNSSGKSASTTNAKTGKSFANLATKVTAAYLTLKKAGDVVASWIKESNDYVENLNLFTVAMGGYADSAKQYAEEVGELMGIDPSAWMRSQGVFMTLATGFGVAGDRAAAMSQQLTQLGYDISSFYNTSVEDAMTKLQSGISGEIEPLRRLGYDLSQAKLEATALSLGIDKSVSSMTQAEKAELRYYAIMTQVTTAQGDMARTLDAPANQMRVLSAQATQAARALGDLFIPALNAILPVAIAALKVITSLAKIIARLFNGDVKENVSTGMGNLANNAGSAGSAIEGAAKSAKKLKRELLGIDELNVMSSNTSDSEEFSGSGFDFELPTYDFIGDMTETRVAQIVDDMKAWLGITDDISSWAELMDTRFGSILKTVGAIGVGIAAWKTGSAIYAVFKFFKNSGIITFFSNVGFAISAVIAKAATLGEAIQFVFAGATGIIGGAATAIVGLIGYIVNLISMFREGESVSNMLGAALGGLATSAGGFLIAIGVGASVATGGIVAAVIAAVAAVGMLIAVIVNHWEEIKAAIATAWDWLYEKVLAPIGEWFAGAATWFYDNVIMPIVNFFAPIVQAIIDMAVLIYTRVKEIITGVIVAIGSVFSKIWEIFLKIVEIAVALGKAFYTYVIQPVVDFIVSIATWVYDKAIKPIISFFAAVGTWLYKTIITPIWDGIVWLKDKAVSIFTTIGTTVVNFVSGAFKSVINGVLYGIESTINGFIKLLNAAIGVINKIPGVNITKVSLLSIPRLADGGMVNDGQMFIAREAGPEMVGSIGNRTAVVNNDQIVESVSRGVYQAVVSAMGQSGGTQVVEAKVNDKVLFEVVVNRNRQETMRTGYSPLLGGV